MLRTSGGPIFVSNTSGRVNAHTSGGPIHIREVAGDVEASTSGGGISIERNLGRVRAHTSGGGIEITEARGAIEASTSGGGVTASLVGQPNQDCRFDHVGRQHPRQPEQRCSRRSRCLHERRQGVDRLPRAVSRDRHERELRAPINGGGPLLYLHTSGGGISVRRTG